MWQYDNSYLEHYGVLGMKWGIRRARKNKQKAARARARGDTESAAKYSNRARAIEQKHKDLAGSDTYNRVKNMSNAKAVGQTLVFGTYGALKYNQARSAGSGRLRSAAEGIIYLNADILSGGLARVVEPRVSEIDRRERRYNQN